MTYKEGKPEDHPYRNGVRVIFRMRRPPNWKAGPPPDAPRPDPPPPASSGPTPESGAE